MSTNGLHATDADEQYAEGLAHGRKVLAEGISPEGIERALKFDRHMAETQSPVFAQFHQGRIDGLQGA